MKYGLLLIALLAGCDSLDQAYDCSQICERWRDCADSDYDVNDCVDRCEDDADRDEDFAERADDCETCLDDRSCTEAVACVDECVGIVP